MAFAYCLNCGSRIHLGRRPWIGQSAFCDRCGADLEVIETNPLEIEWSDNLVEFDLAREPELETVPA